MYDACASSVSDAYAESARRFSTPTFWIRPGNVYLYTAPPPNCDWMASTTGESMLIRFPLIAVMVRS
jgi:hypothetical protein